MKFLNALILLGLSANNLCYALDDINNTTSVHDSNDVPAAPSNPDNQAITPVSQVAGVIGYQAATNNEIWQQKQLGFGVTTILQQALMDKTTYSLLDEKVLFGIKNDNLEEDIQAQWMLNEDQTTPDTLKTLAEKHQLTDVFWVKITDFVSKKSKASFALFGSYTFTDKLTLEVCRYSTATKITECQEGESTESRSMTGVLYRPTDKVKEKFKESGAGKLSQTAILEALSKLLKL
jgi:hypothetical protein